MNQKQRCEIVALVLEKSTTSERGEGKGRRKGEGEMFMKYLIPMFTDKLKHSKFIFPRLQPGWGYANLLNFMRE